MDVEVIWYGQTCCLLRGQDSISIVTDPYPPDAGLRFPRLQADVVTVSHHNAAIDYSAAVQGPFKLLAGPGEYEISGVFVAGVSSFADDRQGRVHGLNTVFAFDFDGTTICHLGRLGHVPTQSQVKNLGSVNVLLVPVGGGGSLSSTQASEVIGLFEPDLVVPMQYHMPGMQEDPHSIDHFLKEMGMEEVEGQATLRVGRSAVLEETKIVLLEPVETH
ncbi:MAG: MBL fold metallo-hydrolase [Anaerolineae bacterium]